jgi:hypothetical protein
MKKTILHFKRSLFFILLTLLFFPTTNSLEGQNLLNNPGFDVNALGWNIIAAAPASASKFTSGFNGGANGSARFFVGDVLTLNPNMFYTDAMFRNPGHDAGSPVWNGAAGNYRVAIYAKDPTGNNKTFRFRLITRQGGAAQETLNSATFMLENNGWQLYEAIFPVAACPGCVMELNLACGTATGRYHFDEAFMGLNIDLACSETTAASGIGATDGEAEVDIQNGTGPYTIDWDNGMTTGTQAGVAGANAITGLAAGSYDVTVTDANGNTGICNFMINNASGPLYVQHFDDASFNFINAGGIRLTLTNDITCGMTKAEVTDPIGNPLANFAPIDWNPVDGSGNDIVDISSAMQTVSLRVRSAAPMTIRAQLRDLSGRNSGWFNFMIPGDLDNWTEMTGTIPPGTQGFDNTQLAVGRFTFDPGSPNFNGNEVYFDYFSLGGAPNPALNSTCPFIPGSTVPTMGEWAMFILFLLILNLAVIFIMATQNRVALAGKNQTLSMTSVMRSLPFDKGNFGYAMPHAFGLALIGFFLINIGWGEIVSTDFIGMAISIPLIAYFIHLFLGRRV